VWPEVFRDPTLQQLRAIASLLDGNLNDAGDFCEQVNSLRADA